MLYRFIGVSDIAAVRFSLPAQLLEPTPNVGTYSHSDNEHGGNVEEFLRLV